MLVVVPAVIAFWLAVMLARNRRQAWLGVAGVALVAAIAFALLVGPDLHLQNFIFLVEPDFASVVRSRIGEVSGAVQFPNVWHAFGNSLLIAGAQTVVVVTVASLAVLLPLALPVSRRAPRCCARCSCCTPSRC